MREKKRGEIEREERNRRGMRVAVGNQHSRKKDWDCGNRERQRDKVREKETEREGDRPVDTTT